MKKIAKTLLCYILLFVLCFPLSGCAGKDIEAYREEKKKELQIYADAKGEENYNADGWQAICNTVEAGKAEIMDKTTKDAVKTAFENAKSEIDSIERRMGSFYTLQEAYDQELLAIEDIQSIAYYHSNGTSPTEALTIDYTSKIKEVAAKKMRERESDPVEDAKAEDFSIIRYYGLYKGCVACMINDPYHEYPAEDLDVNEVIAGIHFHYTNPNRIIVWKQ